MGALHAAPTTGQHLLLDHVPWETFEELSSALEEFPLRMTYDRGRLEIMPISHTHDWVKRLIGRMIEMIAVVSGCDIKSAGSTTQMRRGLDRSLEPDESYYLANEPLVRHKEELDFERDPPPDLVVEIDITNSSLDRLSIYAAMGVPEVWRYDRDVDEVHFLHLASSGEYEAATTSRSFPLLSPAVLNAFLAQRHEKSERDLIREFADWVRSRLPSDATRTVK